MKSDRVYVVLPKYFKHGKSTLRWALLNVAKNGERLFIVHVHRHKHISPKALEKIGEKYVSMRKERKVRCVSCPLQITKNYDAAKGLAKLIDREGITKLVMRGAADKRYSEEMKSLEFNTAIKLMKTAPLTCKIWFTCNGQLICTREANATVPAIQPPPVDSHALKMEKKKIHTGRASSHTKAKGPSQRSRNERGAKKRLQERKDKGKSYQLDLKNAEKELRLEKQIEEVEPAIKSLEEIARNEYFLQEPEAAVTEAGGLYEKNDQQSAMTLPAETVNTEFCKDDIEKAIELFGKTMIGKGGSGSVYKGSLQSTVVAIKMLHQESMQEEPDFIQKVAVLGRVRHPNLVTLIGVCREVLGLVYEFLPNGSLQDQLACRNGMPTLKWQVCIKIIREIWTVLTFLHSSKPPLVHGNLKPSKVLLDSNFACKLEASGISPSNGKPTATKEHDLQSFGIIALQLLMTWLSPENDAVKVVDEANKKGELDTVLKTTAWDWPPELAKRLAHIGLRCVGMSGGLESPAEAPPDDLAEEVRQLFVAADRFAAASQEQAKAQAPDHFRCPISNVLMVDPHITADGHTYDCKSINTWWFTYKKDISPVTREIIADKKLIPNRIVKWMIEHWMEEQQGQVRTSTVSDPNPVQSSQQGHPTIPPAAQSQPPTGQLQPDPVTSLSVTPLDPSAEAQLQLQPPPASSSPPTTTTLILPTAADAHSRSRSTAPVPLNTSAAARSHRLNPLPANPSAAAPPPPRPVSPSSTDFLPPHTGIRRRRVNGRLPSSSTEPDVPAGPGETSRIRGKVKHQ